MELNLLDLNGEIEPSTEINIEIEKLQISNIRELIHLTNSNLNLMFDDILTLKFKKTKLIDIENNISNSIQTVNNTNYSNKNIYLELINDLEKLKIKTQLLLISDNKEEEHSTSYIFILFLLLCISIILLFLVLGLLIIYLWVISI
jgi:hypothetical protein